MSSRFEEIYIKIATVQKRDKMLLLTVMPLQTFVNLISIDLWSQVPNSSKMSAIQV